MSIKEKLPESHLEENLATFAGLLRREGLPIGTTEMFDALYALSKIDLLRRDQFKAALQATLVKARSDQPRFDRLFDNYFVPYEAHRKKVEEADQNKRQLEQRMDLANSELQFKGESLQLSDVELQEYSSLSQEQRVRLQDFVQRTETGKNVEPRFRPLLETVVKSHLRYCKTRKNEQGSKTSNGSAAGSGSDSGNLDQRLREMDIEAIKISDMPAAEQLLQKLSRKLAVQILRRQRSGSRTGPLDLRKSMRDNMRFGGIIFNLKHKPKRRSRQQILLLCDVSASMKQYSTFVIQFLYGLQEAVRNLSCFSFSDNLENLTPELQGRTDLKYLLDRIIRRSSNWGGGTNLGLALAEIAEKYPDLINGKTSVIVVSDTKTVAIDRAVKELGSLKDRVKRIIWLNPVPVDRWPDYRSVSEIGKQVEMWPCSTIAQLETVLTGRL